ncbi:MAG: TIGR04283 family arsenosugar biosynthesis glycosyltransferase [Nitrospinota bacterium]
MKLSVIIPTLNEETLIEKNLSLLKAQLQELKIHNNYYTSEIVVADGGSKDRTSEIARRFTNKICISPKGRGVQMNAGAGISEGDYLLFLHADSILSLSGIQGIFEIIKENNIAGGAFRLKIDSKRVLFKIISSTANMRSKMYGLAYGDQGIFAKRDIFYKVGGYPDIPLMEDVNLVLRLKKIGKFIILPEYIMTSSRRWDNEGILYTTIRNWILISLYLSGVSPYTLKNWYKENGENVF